MDLFAQNIKNIIDACTPYAWILPIVGCVVLGACLGIPSEATHNFAKKHWAGVLIGTLLVSGGVYMGDWYFGKITF